MAERKKKAATSKEEVVEETPVEPKKRSRKGKKESKKTHADIHAEWVVAHKEAKKKSRPAVHQATALVTGVRVTPRKVRLVLDVVRGKNVKDALALLKHINKAAALPVYKLIESAASNATNNFGLDEELLYVSEIQASDGIKMKRYLPRAKGSSSGLIKRTSNIRVVVKERN